MPRPWRCSPVLQPNHLLSWLPVPGAEPSGHAAVWPPRPGEHPATSTARGWSPGASRLAGKQMPRASALQVSGPCADPAVPARGWQCLLPEKAGSQRVASTALQGRVRVWAGHPAACRGSGTSLTSSLGALAQHWPHRGPPAMHQPYLLARSCLRGLLASGQSALWCFAAGCSVPGWPCLGVEGTQHERCPSPEQAGNRAAGWWLGVPGCIGLQWVLSQKALLELRGSTFVIGCLSPVPSDSKGFVVRCSPGSAEAGIWLEKRPPGSAAPWGAATRSLSPPFSPGAFRHAFRPL